jgi:hypothetical protein
LQALYVTGIDEIESRLTMFDGPRVADVDRISFSSAEFDLLS